MSREMCYRCFWPKALCWCDSIRPMPTRTKLVFLIHPKEYKDQRTGTGQGKRLKLMKRKPEHVRSRNFVGVARPETNDYADRSDGCEV